MSVPLSILVLLAAPVAFAKDVEYVFVPGQLGAEIAKVESVTIDGKPVRFEAVAKSGVCTLIDFYRRSSDGFDFESTGNYVPLLRLLDSAVRVPPALKERVPLQVFRPLLDRRVHKTVAVDSPLVRLMYVASGRWEDLGKPFDRFFESYSEFGQSNAMVPTISHELLQEQPQPLGMIIPVFSPRASGSEWRRIRQQTKSYNGFAYTDSSPEWNRLVDHARSLLRSGQVLQIELPATSSKPELFATVRGTDAKGKRFEFRRRLR